MTNTMRRLSVLALLSLALGVTACGDDEEPTAPAEETDTGENNGSEDTGGEDTEGGEDGDNPSLDTGAEEDTTDEPDEPAELDCVGILNCINGGGDLQVCGESGSAEAQGQFGAVVNCIQTNCGTVDEAEYANCQQEFCSGELATCTGQAAPEWGDGVCSDVLDCLFADVLTNPSAGQAEVTACYERGTQAEALLAQDILLCALGDGETEGPCAQSTSQDGFLTCAAENCGTESAACYPAE